MTRYGMLGIFTTCLLLTLSPLQAGLVEENFNSYGESPLALGNGIGTAGDGWAGGWVGETTVFDYPSYQPNSLSYPAFGFSNPGYDASENLTTEGSGQARGGKSAGRIAYRTLSTPAVGTVWISALVNIEGDSDVLLWLDSGGSTSSPFVGLRNDGGSMEARMRADGDYTSDNTAYAQGTTWLLLAKATIDTSGSSDTLEMWIKGEGDDLSSLGAAIYTSTGTDLFGSSIDDIGLSFGYTGGRADVLRISDSATAYQDVLLGNVPEPATILLIAAGFPALLKQRRKRR